MARNPRRAMRRPAPNLERIPDGRAKPARRRLLDGPRTPGGPQEAILKAVDKHQVRNQTGWGPGAWNVMRGSNRASRSSLSRRTAWALRRRRGRPRGYLRGPRGWNACRRLSDDPSARRTQRSGRESGAAERHPDLTERRAAGWSFDYPHNWGLTRAWDVWGAAHKLPSNRMQPARWGVRLMPPVGSASCL